MSKPSKHLIKMEQTPRPSLEHLELQVWVRSGEPTFPSNSQVTPMLQVRAPPRFSKSEAPPLISVATDVENFVCPLTR